jgi:predicted transposase/invertase (TIGR01784 family)
MSNSNAKSAAKKPILSPKSDYIFKLVFGNEKNKHVLQGFLQAVLDLPAEEFQDLEIIDPHMRKTTLDGKLCILDLKVKTPTGNLIAIEIQVLNTNEMKKRAIYGLSKVVAEQLKSGDEYKILKKAISILITDFTLIKENDACHNKFRFFDPKTNTEFSNTMEINTLELSKIPEIPKNNDEQDLWFWLKFLKSEREEELEMCAKASTALHDAVDIVKELGQMSEVREEYEIREKALRDYNMFMGSARREGIEEGMQKGMQKGMQQGMQKRNYEIAKKMLKSHIDVVQISDFTELDIQEIRDYAT